MATDRTWMINRSAFDRRQPKYIEGVEAFLGFAFKGKDQGVVLRCRCMNCLLAFFKDQEAMWYDLMYYGIMNDYDPWDFHGEDPRDSDEESSGEYSDVDDDMPGDDTKEGESTAEENMDLACRTPNGFK